MNFCARSVVTCDSYIDADEILVPSNIASRLTHPVVVHAFNHRQLTESMHAGKVLFLQRSSATGSRMRSITHVAIQNYTHQPGDCLIRRGVKFTLERTGVWLIGNHSPCAPPFPAAEDVPLPIQSPNTGFHVRSCFCDRSVRPATLCFGDRIRRRQEGRLIDPLATITWPVLHVGDTPRVIVSLDTKTRCGAGQPQGW